MKFVKGLALSFLSFLLFLSLSTFGLMFMLNNTVLNPDFTIRELDKLDAYSLAEELLREQVSQLEVPPEYEPYVAEILDDTFTELEPWIKEQVSTGVYIGYDYFMGRSQHLSLTISFEPVSDSLKENLRETVLSSPPPELQGLPPAVIEMALNEANRQIDEQIPQGFQVDRSTLDPEVTLVFEQIKQYIDYFQLGYKLLIGFALLLILGIVLIYREVRGATRSLGITFLTCGVFTYLGNLATKYFIGAQFTQVVMPAQLQTRLPQLLSDLLAPLDIYSIVLAAIGVVLLIVSFVYKPRSESF